jgi:7,8-dihydropterin-6-yl-methyl-4-(beta-D-ribofuranosyl)aminobenzene 5'-phosphate synthase
MINNTKKQVFKIFFLVIMTVFLITGASSVLGAGKKIETGSVQKLKITILYDNYIFTEGTKADWGFACLVEGPEKTILFDTGMKPEVLKENIEKLNIDLSKIDLVVISHNHMDHLGGLPAVYEKKSPVEVLLPASLPKEAIEGFKESKAKFSVVEKPIIICNGVLLTGVIGQGIPEQALVINTSKGFVVITGCAHPGIVEIIKRAVELTSGDMYLVLGGFHLLQNTDEQVKQIIAEMKALGVKNCSASHCTGDKAIAVFKESFGENYIPLGVGKIITIE